MSQAHKPDGDMPSVPNRHIATRGDAPGRMLIYDGTDSDRWVEGTSVDPTEFR